MDAAMDAAIDEEVAAWQPLLAPMVGPLQAFLDEAQQAGLTAQEVVDGLPEVLARMDAGALTAALTRLQFAAAASEWGAGPGAGGAAP